MVSGLLLRHLPQAKPRRRQNSLPPSFLKFPEIQKETPANRLVFFLSCPNTLDAGQNRAPHGGAALLRRTSVLPQAKTLAEAEFISAEHFKVPGIQKRSTCFAGASFLEVTPGFEPGNQGFADPCLTTWLCHHLGTFILYANFPEKSTLIF